MTKRIINVGAAPGNLGDGDTLRDAFVKTNANFDELFVFHTVVDTTLDHDDPAVDGTIAKALEDTGNAGGGLVLVGPGIFTCPNTTLRIPENVTLKGVGRNATTVNVTGTQDGITIDSRHSSVESLRLKMPKTNSGDGIKITINHTYLRDIFFTGLGSSSWAINADHVNVCSIDNILMGTIRAPGNSNAFTGNGIIFQNTDASGAPFNFGDSRLAKIDITLAINNTTGIKFHGPDDTNNVINNILLSQISIIGTGATGGCTGIHIRNAQRITCQTVDIEQVNIAIREESFGNGANLSGNNVFISTFVFTATINYDSSGNVNRRLVLGCDNLTPGPIEDNDSMVPKALWLNDGKFRLWGSGTGRAEIDAGSGSDGIQFITGNTNVHIRPSSADSAAIPLQASELTNVADGTLIQYAAGVVGAQRGLYQLREGAWIFIG